MIRDRRGWTVLELVVAVGILGLLLTFATVAQSDLLPHYRLSAATRQVVTDLRLVRAKAIAQDQRMRVLFTAGSNEYQVERRDPASGTWQPYALYRRGSSAGGPNAIELPSGVSSASTIEVTFQARGTVIVSGGSLPLVLSAPGPRTRDITITAAGLISIS